MKSSDIRELSTKELEMKLAEIKQELLNLRFSHATGSLKNPKQITLLKKDIARTSNGKGNQIVRNIIASYEYVGKKQSSIETRRKIQLQD